MRDKKEIMKDANAWKEIVETYHIDKTFEYNLKCLLLEILIDIRDELVKINKNRFFSYQDYQKILAHESHI